MGSCLVVFGGATKEVFEAYIERVLTPALRPGQVLIADNLAGQRARKCASWSRRGAANCSSYRRTRRTTTPSRRCSRRSRECYGIRRLGRVGSRQKRWDKRS